MKRVCQLNQQSCFFWSLSVLSNSLAFLDGGSLEIERKNNSAHSKNKPPNQKYSLSDVTFDSLSYKFLFIGKDGCRCNERLNSKKNFYFEQQIKREVKGIKKKARDFGRIWRGGGQLDSKTGNGEQIRGMVPGQVSANGCPRSSRGDDDEEGPLHK